MENLDQKVWRDGYRYGRIHGYRFCDNPYSYTRDKIRFESWEIGVEDSIWDLEVDLAKTDLTFSSFLV